MTSADPLHLVAGRVTRAQGLRGEVVVHVRSDDVDRRFVPGAVMRLEPPPEGGPAEIVVAATRSHHGRLIVRFASIEDRDRAEALVGRELHVDVSAELEAGEPDEWFVMQLRGCLVEAVDGTPLGRVADVVPSPAHDLLVVERGGGGSPSGQVLVPFVTAMVPVVDVAGGRIVVDPPGGLFDG